MNEFKRADVKIGMHVKVIMKEDQRTGKLTEGIIKDILTPKIPEASSRNKSTTCPKDSFGNWRSRTS